MQHDEQNKDQQIKDQQNSQSLNLQDIRQQIDSVDEQIHHLINQRAKLAETVAKAKFSQDENPVFYRPEREAQVLRNVMARNQVHCRMKLLHACSVRLCRHVLHWKHHSRSLF